MTDQQQPPKQHGCFFYGCITAIIVVVLGALTAYFGVRYVVNSAIEKYTDEKPAALSKVSFSTNQMAELQTRVDAFKAALDHPKDGFQLELSADELNALIASSTDLAAAKDKLFVRVEDDKVKGDLSIPMDNFAGVPFASRLKGRYLNGSAALKVGLENGRLNVRLDSLAIKGQQMQGNFMTTLKAQNLAQDVANDPQNAAAISKFESIQIKDGKIIIKAKGAEKTDEKPPEEPKKSDDAK